MKLLLLPAALLAALLASCAPSTPDARIAAQPALFESLPAKQKDLVRQGRIDKGMGTDAVYLAWGRASREFEGSENGAPTLRWDYEGSTPVYHSSFYGSYGYGYGRYGRYGRYPGYYGFGIGPEVTYLPYRRASVLFKSGRVISWERSRR
jgi:hypothetical protein